MKSIINQKSSNILLSIGMIVKNEEKVLGRCLESLKPLMAAVSSELIIADTGSTDSTVEIAKKYTDNVFHFEWINDFAAARNSTLEKAKGQWFMFLDADEYLDDDIEEMVNFFNIPELCSKYKTLEIMVRSYTDPEKTQYQDGCLARLHRIDDPEDPVKFVGPVHEGIWLRYPLGYFSTILHHTGYCFSSEKQNLLKKERNLSIMREEYKKNPKDIRMLSHLIDGTPYELEEREKYIAEALSLLEENRNFLYGNVIFMQAISIYKDIRPEYALTLCQKYYENAENVEKCVATVAIVLLKAKILSGLARYEEAYDEFKKYMFLYDEYKNNKLILTDISAHPVEGITESEYMRNVIMAALCLKKLKRFDEVFSLLSAFEIDEIKNENFREYLGTIRETCREKKDYVKMAYFYDMINKSGNKEKIELALYMMEDVYYSLLTEEERRKFAEDIVNSGYSGKYTDLMRLVIEQGSDGFAGRLSEFINSIDDWTDGYSESVYLAIKYRLDISEAVSKMKPEFFRSNCEKISCANDDFAGYVLDYGVPESYLTSIKKFAWINALYEKASYRSFNLDDNRRYDLYMQFISLLGDYVSNVYNSEILNDDDINVLPPLHRFGYFMMQAQMSYSEGDRTGYVRGLKKALKSCESMREIISFIIEQFKKTL